MTAVFLPVAVCLFGGIGASCRYLLDVTIKTYWKHAFPLSTFTINVFAGLCAGIVAAFAMSVPDSANTVPVLSESWRLFLATGFLGGFSTFSTAINEMVTLARAQHRLLAATYVLASMVTPVAAVAVGFFIVA